MRLHFCGTRGSTPAPGPDFVRYGGHTSCVAVAHDGQAPSLLLDAGTGARQVWRLLDGRAFDGVVLLSHLHWDHTHGLPFFRAGDDPAARVDLYLPEQDGDAEALLARGMSPPSFPIRPSQLRGRWRFHNLEEGTHAIGGFEVVAREIPHKGGRTFGYRVSDATGSVAYLSDHHPTSLGPGPDGLGERHAAARALAQDVDLLIHEAQYTVEELPQRADFGHTTADYAVALARECGTAALALFHHDPARTDDEVDAVLARARSLAGGHTEVTAAAEGATVLVGGRGGNRTRS